MIGNTDVVVLQGENNDLIIESIRTENKFRGQGSASDALDKIINAAEKRNLIIKGKILPENIKKGPGVEELKVFYAKKGFTFNENNEILRMPKNSLN